MFNIARNIAANNASNIAGSIARCGCPFSFLNGPIPSIVVVLFTS